MTEKKRCLRVLSIDGGGTRGFYISTYLSGLIQEINKENPHSIPFGHRFDLIAGTSTGSIIACALANAIPPATLSTLYRSESKNIFPLATPRSPASLKLVQNIFRRRYLKKGTAALTQILRKNFGERTLAQSYQENNIALAISAIDLQKNRAHVFKTPHRSNTGSSNDRDAALTLVDVCLASSAAPIYRSIAHINDTNKNKLFLDGGLWANNPVLIALQEALAMTQAGDRIDLYMLGSRPSHTKWDNIKTLDKKLHRTVSDWQCGNIVAITSLDAQRYGFDELASEFSRYIDREIHLLRFPQGVLNEKQMQQLFVDETSTASMKLMQQHAKEDVSLSLKKMQVPDDDAGELLRRLFQ